MKSNVQAGLGRVVGLCVSAAAVALVAQGCSAGAPEELEALGEASQALARSSNPPGGLAASQVPQFVAITFDDNFGSEGMGWATDFFAAKQNPAGTGNSGTFDATPTRVSFYHNSTYLSGMQSSWQTALNAGHELGDHTVGHGDGIGYTIGQWTTEIRDCRNALANGLGTTTSNIKGFRAPYLHYNDNAFTVLSTESPAFTYDTSIMGCWATSDGPTSCPWPYTMEAGSADADAVASKWAGRNVVSVGQHPGLWEVPVSVLFVPPDSEAAAYGFTSGLRQRVQNLLGSANNPNFFEQSTGKLVGMDITLFLDARMTRAEVVATLKYTLDQRLTGGNRAPLVFVGHTHVYQSAWDGTPNVPNLVDRRGAISDFVTYALSKPEVRIRPVADIVSWTNSPVALGNPPAAPDRTEGGTVTTSNATPCNATSETAVKAYDNQSSTKWCVTVAPSTSAPLSTVYDFAASDSYAITSYKLTTANDQPTRDPRDWTLQGCQGSCTAGSDTGWVTLDTRTNEFATAGRLQTNTYTFSNATAYQQYRLRVSANRGATGLTQLAEIQLFGAAGTCSPTTCAAQGKNCGTLSDGCTGSLNCGSCTAPQSCGGGGTSNVCGCTPTTCAAQGKNCGSISNGCGGTLSCGSCTSPQSCGGGGTANVCGGGGGSCSPSVPSYGQARCSSTAVYNGNLYRCISQAVGVNGESVGCGTPGVYCSTITPTDAAWGTTAWQLVQACP
jgi:peptidoglycan/xylan/chitin deacetylase (PgdA/CDA1 family)